MFLSVLMTILDLHGLIFIIEKSDTFDVFKDLCLRIQREK